MTVFSPTAAAFEGFRVLRREPRAVLAWVVGNILLFVLIGLSKLGSHGGTAPPSSPSPGFLQTVGRFGPLAYVAAPMLLVFWVALVGAIFRQELRPKDSRWAFMRVAGDEARLAVLGVMGGALVLIVAGLQFALLAGLTAVFDWVYPSASTGVAVIGATAASCFNFWIVVRLSLAPAHTFSERRLSMFGSWSLTRRHFWGLGWMIFLMIVTVFVVFFLLTLLAGFLGGSSLRALDAHRLMHPSPLTIAGLFALMFLLTGAQVVVSVLIYAPLAFAYRALATASEP